MRYLIATGVGLGVTLMLFLLMQALISGEDEVGTERFATRLLDFIRVDEEEMVRLRERVPPEPPPPPQAPPRTPELDLTDQDQPRALAMSVERPRVALPLGAGDGPYLGPWSPGETTTEGDIVPVVRINPEWPREALLQGIEGWVEVEFTVLPDGSVTDARVLDSEPRRLFDRNALRAILRWKFRPRIVDGEAISRRATQRIDFLLDE